MTADEMLTRCRETIYPEPRSVGHDKLTLMMLEKVAPHVTTKTALDVGCGEGPALEWFKENGWVATGIAGTEKECELLRKKRFDVYARDLHDGMFGRYGLVGLVWARHVLEHSPFPMLAIHRFKEAMAPDGILYVEVPAPDTACHHESNKNHYSVLGQRAWLSLFDKSGLAIIEAGTIDLETPAGPDKYFYFIMNAEVNDK